MDLVFEWDRDKEARNILKHGLSFEDAKAAFDDPFRVIAEDLEHSGAEPRWYCIGRVGEGVATIRFTLRSGRVRIIGAGYWRLGRKRYEKENPLYG
jgi:uncharacterized protein